MWKPRPATRHALPVIGAPSRAEAERSRLFSPLSLKSGHQLRTRTWVPAMVPWRATEEGFVTAEVLAWYGRFAEGRPGAIVVEATGIRDVPSGPLLRIGHDRFLPGLTELAEVIHRRSGGETLALIQLIDFLRIRRRPERAKYFGSFLRLEDRHRQALLAKGRPIESDAEVRRALAELDDDELGRILSARELESMRMGEREQVNDTELAHIAELPRVLPDLFADAAIRARTAGFDGVELHYAHAYTMASFLSRKNQREDGYGRSLEGRVRLPLEVASKVRSAIGEQSVLGCRMLVDEIIPGGSTPEDSAYFAVELARAGLDFVSLSTGGKFDDAEQPKVGEAAYPYTGKSGYECMPTVHSDARGPFGRNIAKQAQVRNAVREAGFTTPIVVAGGISTFALAEGILERGEGDIIGSARQTLADPDWFAKLREGRGADVRPCLFTNSCEALDERHKQVTCQQWDRLELSEDGILKSKDGKRRLTAPR